MRTMPQTVPPGKRLLRAAAENPQTAGPSGPGVRRDRRPARYPPPRRPPGAAGRTVARATCMSKSTWFSSGGAIHLAHLVEKPRVVYFQVTRAFPRPCPAASASRNRFAKPGSRAMTPRSWRADKRRAPPAGRCPPDSPIRSLDAPLRLVLATVVRPPVAATRCPGSAPVLPGQVSAPGSPAAGISQISGRHRARGRALAMSGRSVFGSAASCAGRQGRAVSKHQASDGEKTAEDPWPSAVYGCQQHETMEKSHGDLCSSPPWLRAASR